MCSRFTVAAASFVAMTSLSLSCGDGEESSSEPEPNVETNSSTNAAANGSANNLANATANGATGANAAPNGSPGNAAPNNVEPNSSSGLDCDFEAVDGVVTIEAENLPLNEEWTIGSDFSDFQGTGYAFWAGDSFNNDPTHGVMSIKVKIDEPGRYQLHWRAAIGMGTNTTEHNDAWIRFPDAADYYGLKGEPGAEIRRYYKPVCEDQAAMDRVMSMSDVETADCARGSTTDGWMKVYGAGQEWRWGGNTSDSDASTVTAEFPEAGVYTIEFAARADFFLLDTVVFHLETIDRRDARGLPESPCD